MKWQLPHETRLGGKALYELLAVVANSTLECKKKKISNIKLLEYHFWISSIGVFTNSGFPHVVFESDLLTKKLPLFK